MGRLAIGSGYFIFGMGKYGAHELNYSSDIDSDCLLRHSGLPMCRRVLSHQCSSRRLTRQLVSIMQDMTGDGYVFRMDLQSSA